jgi:uncharacterized protein (TIGR03067 family)
MSQESAKTEPVGGKQNLIAKWRETSTGAKVAVVGALLIGLFLCCGLPTIGGGLWLLWPKNESKTGAGGTDKDAGGSAKQDKEAIQGEWVGARITVTFAGDKFVPWDGNHPQQEEAAVFTLYPAKSPKQIDFKYVKDGKTQLAIYELSGDDLKLCIAESGKERPSIFAGNVLVFKRK